jgi:FkbM family methyltransferase
MFETFLLERYYTEIQGEVIDIGANIGDSAIYFALKGASHVYAFEPLSSVHKSVLQNIKLNNLENKITLINGAVKSKGGKVEIPLDINIEDSKRFCITNQGNVEVPLFSFGDIVKNLIKDPYLLKMDCEGCEADIILNSDGISYFEKILVESHPHITKVSDKALLSKLRKLKYKCEERYRVDKTKLFYCSKIN